MGGTDPEHMKDLIESSQLFEASSRMQTASNTLRQMANQSVPDPALRQNLQWVGHFLEEIDLASFGQSDFSANFAVPATEARPFFYEALANIDELLQAAGIADEQKLRTFLTDTFSVLTSGGGKKLPPAQLSLAATLLERFANAMLTQLNGIPPSPRSSFPLEVAV